MQTQQWLNRTHPQTLQIAVFLLYITGAFAILGSLFGFFVIGIALGAAAIAAGYLISNDRKPGYILGVVVAAVPLLFALYALVRFGRSPIEGDFIGFMFDVALFALLVHPQSRDYQRIWFR